MNKDKLYKWFAKNNVTSISPPTGLLLLEIIKEINALLPKVRESELRKDLGMYKNALLVVCHTAAVQQKVVLDQLDVLVKDPERDKPMTGS